MQNEEWINSELEELRSRALLRQPRAYPQVGGSIVIDNREFLNLSCNDYLGLARDPRLIDAACRALKGYGCGATASRLVTGTLDLHERLEQNLALHKGYPAALFFGSGFAVNLGLIPVLVGRNDTVIADRLSHASLIDGVILSRARLQRFQHNDMDDLERLLQKNQGAGRMLIVTESVFSMDGDMAPLPRIATLAERYQALLLVDEAHATGVFGHCGNGLVGAFGLQKQVDFCVGTLSKALGGSGGYVCCSEAAAKLIVSRARSFIYSTAPPPAVAAAALAALAVLDADPELGNKLLNQAAVFRRQLQASGLNTGNSDSQIIPVHVGASEQALELAETLRARGVLAIAIRPPTVPAGTARLRLSVSLTHHPGELEWAAEIIVEEFRKLVK